MSKDVSLKPEQIESIRRDVVVLIEAKKDQSIIKQYIEAKKKQYSDLNSKEPSNNAITVKNALFPRLIEHMEKSEPEPKTFLGKWKNEAKTAADLLSLPGRVIASTPSAVKGGVKNLGRFALNTIDDKDIPYEDVGDKFLENMADKEGSNIVGNIVRDPLTAGTLIGGIPFAGYSVLPTGGRILSKTAPRLLPKAEKIVTSAKKIIKPGPKLKTTFRDIDKNAISITTGALGGATANQLDKGELSGSEFTKDATIGMLGGTAGMMGTRALNAGVQAVVKTATPLLVRAGVNKFVSDIGHVAKSRLKFNKDILREEKIFGTPDEALSRTNNSIERYSSQIKNALEPEQILIASKSGIRSHTPRPLVLNPTVDITDVASRMSIDDITQGFGKEQRAMLDNVLYRVAEIAPDGKVKLSDIPKVKHIIAELRNDFVNPPNSETDKILGKLYHEVDNEFLTKVTALGKLKEVKEANAKLTKLIPIQKVIRNKIDGGIEDKIPGVAQSAFNKMKSPLNIFGELGAHALAGFLGIPPGTSTALFATYGASKALLPKLSKVVANKSERDALRNFMINQGEEKQIPTYLIKRLKGMELSPLEEKQYNDLMTALLKNRTANTINRAATTFGTVGSQYGLSDTPSDKVYNQFIKAPADKVKTVAKKAGKKTLLYIADQ